MNSRRGPQWVYPDRRRCFACRNYFGFSIIKGLYCSYQCAGMPQPDLSPNGPRWCVKPSRMKGGGLKRWFDSQAEAEAFILKIRDPYLSSYCCDNCGSFHVGHSYRRPPRVFPPKVANPVPQPVVSNPPVKKQPRPHVWLSVVAPWAAESGW